MNMKSKIAAALLFAAPFCVHGQNPRGKLASPPNAGEGQVDPMLQNPLRKGERIPTGPQIEMKMRQIELDVALKQYEKTVTLLAEAHSEAQLLDQDAFDEASFKELISKAERRLQRLTRIKAELVREIEGKIDTIEEYRKKYAITDAPVPPLLDPPIGENLPIPAAGGAPPPVLPTPITIERPPGQPVNPPLAPGAPSATPPIRN